MPRMTRAKAAEVAETFHVDLDEALEFSTENEGVAIKPSTPLPPSHRAPLGELAPNSADGNSTVDETSPEIQQLRKSTRGRKAGKKGAAKKSKPNTSAVVARPEIDQEAAGVSSNETHSAPSSGSEEVSVASIKPATDADLFEDRPTPSKPPPTATLRSTRSQLATRPDAEADLEPKSLIDGIGQTLEERQAEEGEMAKAPAIHIHDSQFQESTMESTALDAPASPLPSAVPNVIMSLRKDSPTKRSTSNKENVEPGNSPAAVGDATPIARASSYDTLEQAAVHSATPPRPTEQRHSSRPEDQIIALDELSDALETASKDIPEVPTSPEKKARKSPVPKPNAMAKRDPKKAGPIVRTTKAAQARLSMIQGSTTAPSLGKPRPSTTFGRSNSVRAPTSKLPAERRTVSSSSNKDGGHSGGAVEKKEVVIPHSKPRPISMSFPTPPPPSKSSKAPTQSTFRLPGEAIAEKQRAQREARLAREAEEEAKKKVFKARPVPSLKAAPAVRLTNAARARESILEARDLKASTSAATHHRPSSVATATRPRIASKSSTATRTGSLSSRPEALVIKKRASSAMADLSKPPPASRSIFAASTAGPVKGTAKGKEVFNRVALAKGHAEKEKREKEAAAKQARAEAAERGRLASREWAEKQRLKKLGASKAGVPAEVVGEGEGTGAGMPMIES